MLDQDQELYFKLILEQDKDEVNVQKNLYVHSFILLV